LFATDDSKTVNKFKTPFIIESSIKYKEKIEADHPSLAKHRPLARIYVFETVVDAALFGCQYAYL